MKKLLILDLDNTLIRTHPSSENIVDFLELNIENCNYYVQKRPFVSEFLEFCLEHFRVAIWSAGKEEYVDKVVSYLFDERKKELVFIWSREKCTTLTVTFSFCEPITYYFKRLKKIWKNKSYVSNRKNTLIIDDTPSTYCKNYGNAIRIQPFWGSYRDNDLIRIRNILLVCKDAQDVRDVPNKIYTTMDD